MLAGKQTNRVGATDPAHGPTPRTTHRTRPRKNPARRDTNTRRTRSSSNSNNSRRRSTRGETATIKLQICSDQLGEKNESALPSRRISGAITDSRPRPLVLHAQRQRRRGRKNYRNHQAGRYARAPAADRHVKRAELPKSTRGSPCNHGDRGYRSQ